MKEIEKEEAVYSILAEYWKQLQRKSVGWVHPQDEMLLLNEKHSFNFDFPPPAFVGNVAKAKIIILAANGGYDPVVTAKEFELPGSTERYVERISNSGIATWSEVAPYYRGINYADLIFSGKAAIVNACAYRSRKISEEPENKKMIKKLPSVQFHRRWLLETILPEANSGKFLIIGKRHGLWGLPASIKESRGFIADPAPVSPHLSKVVWEKVNQFLG